MPVAFKHTSFNIFRVAPKKELLPLKLFQDMKSIFRFSDVRVFVGINRLVVVARSNW